MSLFPAYSDKSAEDAKDTSNSDKEWLNNSSFVLDTTVSLKNKYKNEGDIISLGDGAGETQKKKKRKVEKKKKEKNVGDISPTRELVFDDCDLYCVDKTRRVHYLVYKTLTKPVKPRYYRYVKHLGLTHHDEFREKHIMRYFKELKQVGKERDPNPEEELQVVKKAEEYNKKLCESSDITEWIEFVNFQDEFYRSQHIRYSTESERKRAISQKKLDILEKALSYNPKNDELLKYWWQIGNEILSPDELLKHIQKLLQDSPDNIAFWFCLISLKQESLALCTFPSVSELYKKAINAIRNIKTEIVNKDKNLLELLFHYCRFLDHCGHWEILWTILKNNLHLNFGKEINLNLDNKDEYIKKLEDNIISVDKQPIWVTWTKVELMREGVHFLPVADAIEYPQRCVSTDDVMDFILHFHRDVHFQLILICIMLLKVPLLPLNNTFLKVLFPNGLPWILDSPELILSAALHSPVTHAKLHYLINVTKVTRGPQYLRNMEGQSEFLELIQRIFQECISFTSGNQKIFLGLWWLRFNRWLSILNLNALASIPVSPKKIKNLFKDFMKISENRDNLLFYCEYSLFEFNQGNIEASIKTLKTLISSQPSVYHFANNHDKAVLCHVIRTLCEIFMALGQKDDAVKLLINLGRGASSDSEIDSESKKMALHKYKHIAIDLINEIKSDSYSLESFLLPQFSLEWIHCHMWLIVLTQSTDTAKKYVEEVSTELSKEDSSFSKYAREYLWEALSVISWSLERNNVSFLSQILKESFVQFPYNLKILSLMSSLKVEDHGLWWTFKQSFSNPSTILSCTFLICVALTRKEVDTGGLTNRIKSLFNQIISSEGKISSIIHCLRMKFLFEQENTQLDVAQVNAVESCPWNKSVYMGAITVLPSKLMELTDVMIEKELRVHITPDEIQEMRD